VLIHTGWQRTQDGPTRFPYPLLDRVLELEPGVRAVGAKLVSANEPYFAGHFPGVPVVPGVLLCEALAQLGAAVAGPEGALALGDVHRARFRRPVVPGDALRLEVATVGTGPGWRFRGAVVLGDAVVAEVEFDLAEQTGPRIHPTAIVSPRAELAAGVQVGAYAVIGPEVRIGADTWVGEHAVVGGRTTMGARNRIFPFASVGSTPQDLKYRGEASVLTLGDANIVREYVSINPGTQGGGMETLIGSGCLFMVSSHIAHDCRLGDSVILSNGVALAGHVTVESHAIVGGLAGVHQFVRLGESSLSAAGAMVSKDVPPFCTVAGDRARLFGLNVVGLRRRGFTTTTIRFLRRAYRRLFHSGGSRREHIAEVRVELGDVPEVAQLLDFIVNSQRGICR
jgi:UDP-N-acetylglucosamine acyltransferase